MSVVCNNCWTAAACRENKAHVKHHWCELGEKKQRNNRALAVMSVCEWVFYKISVWKGWDLVQYHPSSSSFSTCFPFCCRINSKVLLLVYEALVASAPKRPLRFTICLKLSTGIGWSTEDTEPQLLQTLNNGINCLRMLGALRDCLFLNPVFKQSSSVTFNSVNVFRKPLG